MAVYKVIQDIESEDKLLGPLTLKGLVYAGIVMFCGFLNFKLITSGGGPIKYVFVLVLLVPMVLFGVLASPLGGAQPTEIWLLARVKFLIQSRKRVWNQSGITHLVNVTAPKKIEEVLTKNFSQDEVKSRLSALASTLDSRGWVVKNVNINLDSYSGYFQSDVEADRLVHAAELVQEVPVVDIHPADDMLDAQHNPTAQNFQNLMQQADAYRKSALQEKLSVARTEEYLSATPPAPVVSEISEIKPMVGFGANAHPAGTTTEVNEMTRPGRAAKLELAQSGNDLSVASIAKLAAHTEQSAGEVAVALH